MFKKNQKHDHIIQIKSIPLSRVFDENISKFRYHASPLFGQPKMPRGGLGIELKSNNEEQPLIGKQVKSYKSISPGVMYFFCRL